MFLYDRVRANAWQWFAAPPEQETYGYVESLVRTGMQQRIRHWDWQLEVSQPAVLGVPDDAISPIAAQGQLGVGAIYYATNGNNRNPAAAFLKQGFVRYRFDGPDKSLRIGRFEFIGGQELHPGNATIGWLQANRIAHRLIGNFGFSNGQRSLDGIDAHYGTGKWEVTALAARADQGVFNMNGNPELNVDLQYLSYSRTGFGQHALIRVFGLGYHDGRTGLTKTDNRPLGVRAADHANVRIGAYGGNLLLAAPAGPGTFDFLFWGAFENGRWGALDHQAGAAAVEGGYRPALGPAAPWMRAGWFRSTGDDHPDDTRHNTFFQVLPTPRVYAREPFYNLMNSTDGFLQVMDQPARKLGLRSDLHWLRLTSSHDLWYQGGGAYDNKAFGYVGRPADGHTSFATMADLSADYQVTRAIALNFYYARPWGKSVIGAIYPAGRNSQFGYVEFVYQWDRTLHPTSK